MRHTPRGHRIMAAFSALPVTVLDGTGAVQPRPCLDGHPIRRLTVA
jgi:hypothetical protein